MKYIKINNFLIPIHTVTLTWNFVTKGAKNYSDTTLLSHRTVVEEFMLEVSCIESFESTTKLMHNTYETHSVIVCVWEEAEDFLQFLPYFQKIPGKFLISFSSEKSALEVPLEEITQIDEHKLEVDNDQTNSDDAGDVGVNMKPNYYRLVRDALGRDCACKSMQNKLNHGDSCTFNWHTWRQRKEKGGYAKRNAVAFVEENCFKINLCPQCIPKCIQECEQRGLDVWQDTNYEGDPENRVIITLAQEPDQVLREFLIQWLRRGKKEENDCKC